MQQLHAGMTSALNHLLLPPLIPPLESRQQDSYSMTYHEVCYLASMTHRKNHAGFASID
jgi:hypothetical protein